MTEEEKVITINITEIDEQIAESKAILAGQSAYSSAYDAWYAGASIDYDEVGKLAYLETYKSEVQKLGLKNPK